MVDTIEAAAPHSTFDVSKTLPYLFAFHAILASLTYNAQTILVLDFGRHVVSAEHSRSSLQPLTR